MKPRLNVYLDYDLLKRVEALAAQSGASKSNIVQVAVASYVSPESADKRDAAIIRRLDRLSRQYAKLERDLTITSEALALFIHYQLAIAPPVPVADEAAMKAKGKERFEQFVERLGRRLSEGKSLVRGVVEEFQASEADFFSIDPSDMGEPANDN